jgi:hypothetical protein
MRRLLLLCCLLIGASIPATALAQTTAPEVKGAPAAPVGETTATVHGTVDPNGSPASYRFEYMPVGGEWVATADQDLDPDLDPVPVEARLSGLAANTRYRFRLVAWPTATPDAKVYSGERGFGTIGRPGVSTRGVSGTRADGTTAFGRVDPNRAPTVWYFEWGPTRAYGERTPDADAGSGSTARDVSAAIGGLTPNTTYHYRLVATNDAGTKHGLDRSFRTPRSPTAITVENTTRRIRYGGETTITGTVQGGGVNGIRVALQAQPFPFSGAYFATGSSATTRADGTFTLTSPPLWISTRLRVVTQSTVAAVSPAVTAFSRVIVGARTRRVDKRRTRIEGTVTPHVKGARVSLQRLAGRKWRFVSRTKTNRISRGRFGYQLAVKRARRTRHYRVLVTPRDVAYVRGTSWTIEVPKLTVKKKRARG